MKDQKFTLVAPSGENHNALYESLKHFDVERIYILACNQTLTDMEKLKVELEKKGYKVIIKKLKADIWEGMFIGMAEIKEEEPHPERIIVNVCMGNPIKRCAATTATFVNGLKGFAMENGKPMIFPLLKFNYYKVLTDKKVDILKYLLEHKDCCDTLDELSTRLKMSLPLLSYHINGNLKSEGLKDLGLIETEETKGKIRLHLTTLGKLLVQGYIHQAEEE
jgi:hypothetical protein